MRRHTNRRDVLGDGQLAEVEAAVGLEQLVKAQVAVEGHGDGRARGLRNGGGFEDALLVDLRLRGVSAACAWRHRMKCNSAGALR